jgi:hypothetical protein
MVRHSHLIRTDDPECRASIREIQLTAKSQLHSRRQLHPCLGTYGWPRVAGLYQKLVLFGIIGCFFNPKPGLPDSGRVGLFAGPLLFPEHLGEQADHGLGGLLAGFQNLVVVKRGGGDACGPVREAGKGGHLQAQ